MEYHDPTFKEWMENFVDTDTNIGDLARDIRRDNSFPDSSDKSVIMEYVASRTEYKNVIKTLSAAIDLFDAASE